MSLPDDGIESAARLVERAYEHTRRWLAGDASEANAGAALDALASAFERCKQAGDFDLGLIPGALEQVEKLTERLEATGWRRGQLAGLAARLKPGERISAVHFGAVRIEQPDGRARVVYSSEV